MRGKQFGDILVSEVDVLNSLAIGAFNRKKARA
jgi:hypothetical protein